MIDEIRKGIALIGPTVNPEYLHQAGYTQSGGIGYQKIIEDEISKYPAIFQVENATSGLRLGMVEPTQYRRYKDDDGKRIYEIDGHSYYSVTTILNAIRDNAKFDMMGRRFEASPKNKISWEQHCSNRRLLGSYIHWRAASDLLIRHNETHTWQIPFPKFDIKRRLPEYLHAEFWHIYGCWINFMDAACPQVHPEGLEALVWNEEQNYAGAVDCVATLDHDSIASSYPFYHRFWNFNRRPVEGEGRVRWLIDFKTSKQMDSDMPAQVWAYREAWNMLHPESPIERMAILRMNGNTDGWEFMETEGDRYRWEWAHETFFSADKDREGLYWE